MRIQFAETGGIAYFPGLRKPVTIEVNRLPHPVAEEIRRLVAAARFFDLPGTIGGAAPPGSADLQTYVVTISEGRRRHAVRITPPVEDGALDALVQIVRAQVKAVRAARRDAAPDAPGGRPGP